MAVWNFVFERNLTQAERYISVWVKILSNMLYSISKHNSPFDAHVGSLHTEGWDFYSMFLLSR